MSPRINVTIYPPTLGIGDTGQKRERYYTVRISGLADHLVLSSVVNSASQKVFNRDFQAHRNPQKEANALLAIQKKCVTSLTAREYTQSLNEDAEKFKKTPRSSFIISLGEEIIGYVGNCFQTDSDPVLLLDPDYSEQSERVLSLLAKADTHFSIYPS